MQVELGSLIAGSVAVLVSFVTALGFAFGAKNDAKQANRRCDELSSSLNQLQAKHDALDNKIVDRLSAIEKSLAWIQGSLKVKNDSLES